MRISDLSSDVCSSDLDPAIYFRRRGHDGPVTENRIGQGQRREYPGQERSDGGEDRSKIEWHRANLSRRRNHGRGRDRKSVVTGKRGSERVDLGGRRVIKEKNSNYQLLKK